MHRAIFPEDCYPNDGFLIRKGEYMLEDLHASWFMRDGLCTLEAPGVAAGPLDPAVDWNGKRILIGRSGGIGDLLFATPLLREIRRRWPGARIDFMCLPDHAPVLQGNPALDAVIAYPIPVAAFAAYEGRVWLENAVERGSGVRTTHIVDLFAARAGIPVEDRRAVYLVTDAEREEARALYPRRPGKRRLGIQLKASTPARTYPTKLTAEVMVALHRLGWEVFFGAPAQIGSQAPAVADFVNLPLREPPLTLRQSAAIMATCDAFLGPDSGLVHLAGALEIPTVALYASFPWQLRTAHAPSIHPLTGHLPCAPCFHHSTRFAFPAHGPCQQSNQCDALAQIAPERIVTAIEALVPPGALSPA